MSINAVRYVGYIDDGVDEFECLKCYHSITTRNWFYNPETKELNWKYCPVCGTKWEKYIPEKEKKYYRYDPRRLESVNLLSYRIQERMVFEGEEPYDWEPVAETFGFKDTIRTLKWYRDRFEDDKKRLNSIDYKMEYRYVLKESNYQKNIERSPLWYV